MRLYKLVDQNYTTKNNTKWEIGKSRRIEKCKNPQLCSGDVFHAYRDLNLGLLFNPSHADINNPRILECEGDICVEDHDKVGVFKLKVINEVEIPNWYKDEKKRRDVFVQFTILCAEAVLQIWEKENPDDARPRKALEEAKKYFTGNFDIKKCKVAANATYSANAAYYAYTATNAVYSTAAAYYAAANAASAAAAAYSVAYAANAADAAAAAYSVAYAANAAANAAGINLSELLRKSIKMRG